MRIHSISKTSSGLVKETRKLHFFVIGASRFREKFHLAPSKPLARCQGTNNLEEKVKYRYENCQYLHTFCVSKHERMAGRSELDALLDLVGAGDDFSFDDKKKEKTKKPDKKQSMSSIGGTISHAVHTKHLVEKAAHFRLN